MSDELTIIVKESGLEATKAQVLLDNFSDYFQIAGEWEVKAREIVVTDASQTVEMQMARAGRLFLREKRIHVERTRKKLKEQALREGKAIDGIANVLKALIVPIEEYLEKQEKYVEIKLARIEAEKKAEEEKEAEAKRIAEEEAVGRKQARVFAENERLRKEAAVRDQKLQDEREGREAEQRKVERAEAQLKAEKQEHKKEIIKMGRRIKCPYCHKEFNLDLNPPY